MEKEKLAKWNILYLAGISTAIGSLITIVILKHLINPLLLWPSPRFVAMVLFWIGTTIAIWAGIRSDRSLEKP